MKKLPAQQRLKTLFDYDPATGRFIWRATRLDAGSRKHKHGAPDRIDVTVDRKRYIASRIIWKWMTGVDPAHTIDHIDCNPLNNTWSNLREATIQEQEFNRRVWNRSTGRKGVAPATNGTKRYRARIMYNRKSIFLGYFDTPQDAHAAYTAAAQRLHGPFHRP